MKQTRPHFEFFKPSTAIIDGLAGGSYYLPGRAVGIENGVQALFFHWRVAHAVVARFPEDLPFYRPCGTAKGPEVSAGNVTFTDRLIAALRQKFRGVFVSKGSWSCG